MITNGPTFGENLIVTFSGIAFGLPGPTSIMINPVLMFHKQLISERLRLHASIPQNHRVAVSIALGFSERQRCGTGSVPTSESPLDQHVMICRTFVA